MLSSIVANKMFSYAQALLNLHAGKYDMLAAQGNVVEAIIENASTRMLLKNDGSPREIFNEAFTGTTRFIEKGYDYTVTKSHIVDLKGDTIRVKFEYEIESVNA